MDISKFVFSDAALDVIDNGAWVGDFEGFPGLRLKVRGMRSAVVRKAIEAKHVEMREKNKGEKITNEQHEQITKEVVAETVLIDWDGFTSEGQPFPYNADFAKKSIPSRNGESLRNLILFAASKIDADASAFVEVATKN